MQVIQGEGGASLIQYNHAGAEIKTGRARAHIRGGQRSPGLIKMEELIPFEQKS